MSDYRTELFKTVLNINRKGHPDTEIVRFCGKNMPLGEVRSLYEAFEEKRYNMISFWDDMFQYTSLGLLDLIFEKKKINSPIPTKLFFNRKQTYGKEFVYEVLNHFKIGKEEIDIIEKDNYEELLSRSPLSRNAQGFMKLRNICSSHLLIMKYPIPKIGTIKRLLQEAYGKDEYISLETDYCSNKTEEEYLATLPKARNSYFDIVICQDAACIIEYIKKNDIHESQILTPLNHNGLSLEAQYTFEEYLNGVGPNGSRLHYIKEEK